MANDRSSSPFGEQLVESFGILQARQRDLPRFPEGELGERRLRAAQAIQAIVEGADITDDETEDPFRTYEAARLVCQVLVENCVAERRALSFWPLDPEAKIIRLKGRSDGCLMLEGGARGKLSPETRVGDLALTIVPGGLLERDAGLLYVIRIIDDDGEPTTTIQ